MPRLARLVAGGGVAVLLAGWGSTAIGSDPFAARAAARSSVTARWSDSALAVPSSTLLGGRVDFAAGASHVTMTLQHGLFYAIPRACTPSTTVRRRSYLQGDRLVCVPAAGATSLDFQVLTLGPTGSQVQAAVAVTGSGHAQATELPARLLAGGSTSLRPDLRLLSSPDFLNADVADLRHGPNRWSPGVSANGTDADYSRALDTVLDDWEALRPAGVLVAGDLVDGRWGYDDQHTGTFGPIDTPAQRRAAVRRAARTYFPQWKQRFTQHHLSVFPAPGDHEYGDNPWPARKRDLASTFRSEFAHAFTRHRDGSPIYPDHPSGPAALTAYAGRPTPDLQVISLDDFDITPARARLGLDRRQLQWVQGVLAAAQRDHVRWIVVQGHLPILWPVPTRGSSGLHYPGGEHSRLWRLFERYGVDLYLDGEVHDTSVRQHGGVVQLAHGGLFQFGLTTAAVLDFYGNRLYLSLRDYDVHHDSRHGYLWETRRQGMPRDLSVRGTPYTIGTAVLQDGHLVDASGILVPGGADGAGRAVPPRPAS